MDGWGEIQGGRKGGREDGRTERTATSDDQRNLPMPGRLAVCMPLWYHESCALVSANQRCTATGAAWRASAKGAFRRRTSPPLASTGAGCSRRRNNNAPARCCTALPDRRPATAQTARAAIRTCRPATCPRACPARLHAVAGRGTIRVLAFRRRHGSRARRHLPRARRQQRLLRRTRWRSSRLGWRACREGHPHSSPSCARTTAGAQPPHGVCPTHTTANSQSARASPRASPQIDAHHLPLSHPQRGRTRRSRCRARHLATGSACCASATSTSSRWTSRAPPCSRLGLVPVQRRAHDRRCAGSGTHGCLDHRPRGDDCSPRGLTPVARTARVTIYGIWSANRIAASSSLGPLSASR